MNKQIPPNNSSSARRQGYAPGQVHLFDRFSPLSNIDGHYHYMCGEQYTGEELYYDLDLAYDIGFEGSLASGRERCPKCWDEENVAFALLRQLP